MATFANLPVEMVQSTLFHTRRKDLLTLLYVCKSLRRLTLPLLYQEIRWTSDTSSGRNPPILLLLRSILERPKLASYVEHIEFQGSKPPSVWTNEDHPDLTADELKLAIDVICTSQLPSEKLWIQELENGNADAFVALLLLQLSNLQSFARGFDFQRDSKFVGTMLKHTLFSSPPAAVLSSFRVLQRIEYSADMDITVHDVPSFTVDFDQIVPLFYLPSIQSINMVMPDPDVFTWPSARPCTSTLTMLVLRFSHVKEEALEQLLSVTPSLRTLRYDFDCDVEPPNDKSCHFDGAKLSCALEHVKATIEDLAISVHFYSIVAIEVENGSEYWGIRGNLDSLRHFQILQSLEVPLIVLLGWSSSSKVRLADVLPQQIRQLCIKDDMADFCNYEWTVRAGLDRIHDYLEDWRSHAPNLECVTLTLRASGVRWGEKPQRELRTMCERAGVACDIIKQPLR